MSSISFPFSPRVTRSKRKDDYDFRILRTSKKKARAHKAEIFPISLSTNISESTNLFSGLENLEEFPIPIITSISAVSKKLEISSDERTMNGAPEGTLYDITVQENNYLLPYESSSIAENESLQAIRAYAISEVWADKYVLVETMRRTIIHHYSSISLDLLISILSAGLSEIESLRSCSVRNGLLLLESCFTTVNDVSIEISNNNSLFGNIIRILMNKISSGPRFLCDKATITLKTILNIVEAEIIIEAMLPITEHKNLEISSKAIYFIAESVMKINNIRLSKLNNRLDNVIQVLAKGMSAKKSDTKQKCGQAVAGMASDMGNEIFIERIQHCLVGNDLVEIKRVIASFKMPSASINNKTASNTGSTIRSKFKAPPCPNPMQLDANTSGGKSMMSKSVNSKPSTQSFRDHLKSSKFSETSDGGVFVTVEEKENVNTSTTIGGIQADSCTLEIL